MVVIEEEEVIDSASSVPTKDKEHSEEDANSSSNAEGKGKQSRNEKKARQAIMRHAVEHMPSISRVTIKRDRKNRFSISNASVYKSSTSETFIIFGEAKLEDTSTKRHTEAAQRFTKREDEQISADAFDTVDKEEDVDATKNEVNEKDIALVIEQTHCTRERAIEALKMHNGDFVEAILEVTTGG